MTAARPPTLDRLRSLAYERALDCVHCGLCLPKCPTYRVTGDEAASPRGRIYLMRGLAEGRLKPTPSFADKMRLCLVCRACETVCPSGVRFGEMMEITREELSHANADGAPSGRRLRRFFLRRVIPSRRALGVLAFCLRVYRQLGLARLVRTLGIPRILPRGLRAMEAAMPEVPPAADRTPLPERIEPPAGVAVRGTVALLEGCVMPHLFGAVNHRLARSLADRGYVVLVPKGQTCCGALHAHDGDMDAARELAARNIEAFLAAGVKHVVMDSAGCGAAFKDYAHWFADDPQRSDRARELAEKTVDVTTFFIRHDLEPTGLADVPQPIRATYDAPCHLHHAQGCTSEPLALLARCPGIELVPLPGAEDCCGAAGIYNVTQPEMSRDILERKLDALESTGAELLVTGNPGCILQWRKGIAERGLAVRVAHPVEFL